MDTSTAPFHRPTLLVKELAVEAGPLRLESHGPISLRGGRVYLMLGESGSGKSSLARALMGLTDAVEPPLKWSGSALIEESDAPAKHLSVFEASHYNADARPLIAYMPQAGSLGLIDRLSPTDNARLFSHLSGADAQPRIEALAARLRVWPLPKSVARASGGEQMRLSAVRALLDRGRASEQPLVLVADEPTVGLDSSAAKQLCAALIELARERRMVVIVVTHEPKHIIGDSVLPPAPDGSRVHIVECEFVQNGQLEPTGIAGHFRGRTADKVETLGERLKNGATSGIEALGALVLSPIAFLWGLVVIARRTLPATAAFAARTAFNPGTWLFAVAACVLISVTVGIFLFHLLPRRELVEPLLLPDVLMGFGILLQLMLLPMFSAVFATAKSGAAQAAQLSSSVRSGLLDSLSLARIETESFALVPAVVGQVVSLLICTALASVLGMLAGALVFMTGSATMSLPEALETMWAGASRYDSWFGWLVAKTLVSGFAGGAIAAYFGVQPIRDESDVARAVHRTLLWGMFTVFAIQCAFVIAQFQD